MATINNVHPLSAEMLFGLLKKGLADDINSKLNSNLTIEYAHVYDIINISFPDVAEGIVFTLTVTDDAIDIVNNVKENAHNTTLLEQHLIVFVNGVCG
jgi:hypothetical protein